jgi:nitroreductase
MQFNQLITARRSVRAYTSQPIDERVVERVLHAVSCAPSAGNLQAYEVCLTRSAQVRAALARAAGGQSFIEQAPLALVFCTNAGRAAARYGRRGATLYTVQDATIACTTPCWPRLMKAWRACGSARSTRPRCARPSRLLRNGLRSRFSLSVTPPKRRLRRDDAR